MRLRGGEIGCAVADNVYRVGILNPASVVGFGGGFQYMLSLIEALKRYDDLELIVFYDDPRFGDFRAEATGFRTVPLPQNREIAGKVVRTLSMLANLRSPWVGRFEALRAFDLDCLVSSASLVGFHLSIPFVGIIYDVMYKYYPECAEYPLKERIARDLINTRIGRHAELTVVDSEKGGQDLVRFYGVDPARIRPIPLCPPPHVYRYHDLPDSVVEEVLDKYKLPRKFIFYPAQLWEHKNHRRLLQALVRLREQYDLEVSAVFVGSIGRGGQGVLSAINELGLERQVWYLGYREEREVIALYKRATALVFPSFAEYANIPVLEAMALGTPVLCSNLFAMGEQVAGAGLLFDPFDVDDIAAQIYRIWDDEELRASLARKGRERAATLSLEEFGRRWRDVILEVPAHGR